MKNIFFKFTILILFFSNISASDFEASKIRLGAEATVISNYGATAYNVKFKQSYKLFDYKIEYKIFNRWYTVVKDGKTKKFSKTKSWHTIKTPYHLFWEGQYDFYRGDKKHKRYINNAGAYYKFNQYLEYRCAYTDIRRTDKPSENAILNMFKGKVLNTEKHSLGYENYNYTFLSKDEFKMSFELQYKYHITRKFDFYIYSVNGYSKNDDFFASRIDTGIYFYLKP